jgi:hypothetical protein
LSLCLFNGEQSHGDIWGVAVNIYHDSRVDKPEWLIDNITTGENVFDCGQLGPQIRSRRDGAKIIAIQTV